MPQKLHGGGGGGRGAEARSPLQPSPVSRPRWRRLRRARPLREVTPLSLLPPDSDEDAGRPAGRGAEAGAASRGALGDAAAAARQLLRQVSGGDGGCACGRRRAPMTRAGREGGGGLSLRADVFLEVGSRRHGPRGRRRAPLGAPGAAAAAGARGEGEEGAVARTERRRPLRSR